MSAECDDCGSDLFRDDDLNLYCGWCDLSADRERLHGIVRSVVEGWQHDTAQLGYCPVCLHVGARHHEECCWLQGAIEYMAEEILGSPHPK